MSIEAMKQALEALQDNRRSHYYCEDTWYSCPKHEDGCANEAEGDECNCGADKANEQIDLAITALCQAIEAAEKIENPPIRIQNHAHTDHPMRHWDRTCPACVSEEKNWVPREVVYKNSVYQTPDGFTNIQNKICDQQTEKQEPVAYAAVINGEIDWNADYPFSNEPFTCFDDENALPLYTAPPRKESEQDLNVGIDVTEDGTSLVIRRGNEIIKSEFYKAPRKEWVGLTVREYHEALNLGGFDAFKAIEAKLKEKNT